MSKITTIQDIADSLGFSRILFQKPLMIVILYRSYEINYIYI